MFGFLSSLELVFALVGASVTAIKAHKFLKRD